MQGHKLHESRTCLDWRTAQPALVALSTSESSMHSVLTQCVRGQGHTPDYMYLLQRMMMDNPQAAVSLAKMVAKQPGPPIELNTMADLFLQRSMVREATEFLLDVLTEKQARA